MNAFNIAFDERPVVPVGSGQIPHGAKRARGGGCKLVEKIEGVREAFVALFPQSDGAVAAGVDVGVFPAQLARFAQRGLSGGERAGAVVVGDAECDQCVDEVVTVVLGWAERVTAAVDPSTVEPLSMDLSLNVSLRGTSQPTMAAVAAAQRPSCGRDGA